MRLHWCPEPDPPGGSSPLESRRQRVDRLLRTVLAAHVGLAPATLAFGREEKGRPFLRHDGAPDFNLSDTQGGTLVALCRQGRIGVDLERIDRKPPVDRLSRRWFSAEEADALQLMDAEAARAAFLRLWTAKEASCKATGTGLFGYTPRWRFDADADTPLLVEPPADAGDAARWQFFRLSPSTQHTAVVALRDAAPPRLTGYVLAG
ncbi:MAG: 4'-phosphopantetheinyl transferase superfamily protein [Gammaproteobacteria bacterium]|nr:4'-phosphopantetheinyl transferase superfamily protein [Gammaproteobacteria bacterium]